MSAIIRRPRRVAAAIGVAAALLTSLLTGAPAGALANPTSAVSGAATSTEGAPYVLTLAGTDAAGRSDTLLFAVDWGDGTISAAVLLPPGTVTHRFLDGPLLANVLVMIYDQNGGATRVDLPVSVLDVAPTVAITGAATSVVGASYSLAVGAVADPGRDTVTSTTVRWGDGSSELVTPGTTVMHTYATPGPMAVAVDVVNEDGAFANAGTLAVNVANAVPTAPVGLAASATNRSTIALSWANTTTNQSAVQIDRCKGTGCTSFKRIATVSGTATSFLDQRLSRNTVYVYRVRSRNVVGVSAWSAVASAKTPR